MIGTFSEYNEGDYTRVDDEMPDEIYNYLVENDCKELTINFDAGGDSGWIHDYGINESTGEDIQVPEFISDACYPLLNSFGGWEINEGSTGSFRLNTDEKTIELTFAYMEESSGEDDLNIESF